METTTKRGRGRPTVAPERLELRLPVGWSDQLRDRAAERGHPIAVEVREALAAHLGIDPPEQDRRYYGR